MPRRVSLALLVFLLALASAGAASDVAPAPRPTAQPVAPHPRTAGVPLVLDLLNEDPGLDVTIEVARPELGTGLPIASPPPLLVVGQPDAKAKTAPGFEGRTDDNRAALVKEHGGNAASEKAVANGLAWLAKQQKADGSWEYDGADKDEVTAATGMAVLAFLGAGETHLGKGKYAKAVNGGLNALLKNLSTAGASAGKFAKAANMYGQAIGTLALVEAYAVSKDRKLLPPAQAAVNFIQRAQAANGSWGYQAGTNGDTSILGWQTQAIYAAALTKDIKVDPKVVKKAIDFLDVVAAGTKKEKYGYSNNAAAAAGTSLTAIGLWCRHSVDKWGPDDDGMAAGVEGLMARAPGGTTKTPRAAKPFLDTYFYYYATQVVFRFAGDEWKDWNEGPKAADNTRKGGLRDWLVELQINKEGKNQGSWDPDGAFIGRHCGRLGTTALSVLTLEVYYRYLPLYKRDGGKIVEDK